MTNWPEDRQAWKRVGEWVLLAFGGPCGCGGALALIKGYPYEGAPYRYRVAGCKVCGDEFQQVTDPSMERA